MTPSPPGRPSSRHSDTEILVVGAGPVGLGVAIEAALRGRDVTVVEQRSLPVDKACGEGLMPSARRALARLGVEPPGWPFRGIRYVAPGSAATADFRTGAGLGVRRVVLSSAMHARAEQLGVRFVQARLGGLDQGEDSVEAAGMRARWLVAADGLHSPLRRSLGLAADDEVSPVRRCLRHAGASGAPPRYGLRRHFRVQPWSEHVEVHWSAAAEAYVTPVAEDVVGVAVLGPPGTRYDEALGGFCALSARLRDAEPGGPVRGAGPLRQSARRRVLGRVALVGDAAGYVDALTGEGIAIGLLGARALVDCLDREDLSGYDVEWRRISRRYRMLTATLLAASRHPQLRARLVPAAQSLPWMFRAAVHALE